MEESWKRKILKLLWEIQISNLIVLFEGGNHKEMIAKGFHFFLNPGLVDMFTQLETVKDRIGCETCEQKLINLMIKLTLL